MTAADGKTTRLLKAEMAQLVEEILEAVEGSHPAMRKKVFYVVEAHHERLDKILANRPFDQEADQ